MQNAFSMTKIAAAIFAAVIGSSVALADTATGGFATVTGGGSAAQTTVNSFDAFQAAITAYDGTSGLVIYYTGNEDSLINAAALNPCGQWSKATRIVEIKGKSNITIIGAPGSSANFTIHFADTVNNVIVRGMKIGYVPGGASNGDAFTIDKATTNLWLDHNELFAANVDSVFPTFTPDGVTKPTQVWCPGTPGNDTAYDGLMDIKGNADNITISYNYIHDFHKVGLDGSSDSDTPNRHITYHHNVYSNVGARLPLQRFGYTHMYNNYYNGITTSGINVRMTGHSLIEGNWFQNALNPVTSRDSSTVGYWDLRNNNISSPNDFGTYNITWDTSSSVMKNATDWTTTGAFPSGVINYSYTTATPTCVQQNLINAVGSANVGKSLSCSGSSSSSASSTASSSSSSSTASSSSSSKASSSAASSSSSSSSSAASSSSSSSSSSAPVLSGTGDYPTGFSKCADLGGTCSVNKGTGWVAFGRNGSWVAKYVGVGKSIACTVAAFGSEPNGNPDKCSFQN